MLSCYLDTFGTSWKTHLERMSPYRRFFVRMPIVRFSQVLVTVIAVGKFILFKEYTSIADFRLEFNLGWPLSLVLLKPYLRGRRLLRNSGESCRKPEKENERR